MDKVKDKERFSKIYERVIKESGGYEEAKFSLLGKDLALNDCIEFPKGWFWVLYNPFKIELKRDEFELSDSHKVRYLAYMTKYIENVSNLASSYKFSVQERNKLIQGYELFLFEILEAYFDIINVKINS